MQKFSGEIIRETLWVLLSLVIALIFSLIIFANNGLDIHFHDTYFVLSPLTSLLPLFFLVTFCLYLIKTRFKKFKTNFSYWVLIGSGFFLTISLTFLIKIFSGFGSGDWTIYPPLSSLGTNNISQLDPNQLPHLISNFLILIQIVVLLITLIVAFRFGRRKQIQTYMKDQIFSTEH